MAASRGLTLLELLVVLAIVGVVSAALWTSWYTGADRRLDRQAETLQSQIEAVRIQARLRGQAVEWAWDEQGWSWRGLPSEALPELPRRQTWLLPATAVHLEPTQAQLRLGPEPMGPPWRLELHHGAQRRALVFAGWGAVRLE
ncbi:MAG: GspH/FimT family pseudopilin [Tepidimonas sp.]|uniref:GspH/FimT family pseudopilin n=1 Tax=Tepidimonas sp. TaxID=2002775 RepID=UPI00298F2C3C|nr:GspH/FimT family pseudopilin [Tepidimonas sp.]MCS6810326.1 GspH/FimT family pseudopilin [Tepidimonas sp.]MCX7742420.1 GspH/FimT family pseudopilin [Tepidimonas sp.]MDW8336533.1 GspH/FimT family pseudopilin [Tepidimonas sp.]